MAYVHDGIVDNSKELENIEKGLIINESKTKIMKLENETKNTGEIQAQSCERK